MSTATLNIRVPPRRMLTPRDAAEYCGVPAKQFPTQCGVSPLEMPNGARLYDMRDLDRWIDGLKANHPDNDEEIIRKLGT
jgi:hypothetical protein